jgi:hypothetical protein
MSDHVEISKRGLYFHKWNGNKRKDIPQRVKEENVLSHLRRECRIAEGTTLGQLFKAVDSYEVLKLFFSQYSWCPVQEFHDQAREKTRTKSDEPLDYLEISWIADSGKRRDDTWFEMYQEFMGYRVVKKDQELYGAKYKKGELIRYGTSCCPMYDLTDVPIRLNEEVIVQPRQDNNLKCKKPIIESRKSFSLLDVLDSVYDEISFHGGPKQSAAFLQEMKETVEKIKSGKLKTKPFSEVMEKAESQYETDITNPSYGQKKKGASCKSKKTKK